MTTNRYFTYSLTKHKAPPPLEQMEEVSRDVAWGKIYALGGLEAPLDGIVRVDEHEFTCLWKHGLQRFLPVTLPETSPRQTGPPEDF